MKKSLFLLTFLCFSLALCAQPCHLERHGSATQFVVDGQPFLVLGGELGNSSATCAADIERIFPQLQRMGLNTVLVPAYWDLTEPTEGTFDFSLTDKVISTAQACDLKVIFLWFGAWKNSMSCYTPSWFKGDYKRFPRAQTAAGKPLEIASVFSDNVLAADKRAFSAWLQHIASVDSNGTVIMIQIENEIGMLEDARDYSPVATKAFNSAVPAALTSYLTANKKTLHPQMAEKWAAHGSKTAGTWQELFGSDLYTDEIFMAWHYACYVEQIALAARSIYDIPLYVNAAMNSRGRQPGEYPSAGPLAHLIDIWHAGAPTLDLLAPDLYDLGFTGWVEQYKLENNPLFIPEIRLSGDVGVRAFYVFGEKDAMGFSPFSIEDAPEAPQSPLCQAYDILNNLMPLLLEQQGQGTMHGLHFDKENTERIIVDDDLTLTCRHFFTLPWDPRAAEEKPWPEGGAVLIKLAKNDYLLAGSGVVIEFAKTTEKAYETALQALGEDGFVLADGETPQTAAAAQQAFRGMRQGIASVEEVRRAADGTLTYVRSENGDQTHQGRHVRIPTGEYRILHIKLYEYK